MYIPPLDNKFINDNKYESSFNNNNININNIALTEKDKITSHN
jgi:hypothetical protein